MKTLFKSAILSALLALSFNLFAAPVNINTADSAALESLPGIGPSLAQRIIDHRQAQGPFERTEDIMEVPGIGEATFEGIQDLITTR